jgi:hypothetical protein
MHRKGERHQRLAAIFFLGLVLLLPPLLLVFNRPAMMLGIPILFLYLFLAWAGLIALGAAVAQSLDWDGTTPQRERAVPHEASGAAASRIEAGDA